MRLLQQQLRTGMGSQIGAEKAMATNLTGEGTHAVRPAPVSSLHEPREAVLKGREPFSKGDDAAINVGAHSVVPSLVGAPFWEAQPRSGPPASGESLGLTATLLRGYQSHIIRLKMLKEGHLLSKEGLIRSSRGSRPGSERPTTLLAGGLASFGGSGDIETFWLARRSFLTGPSRSPNSSVSGGLSRQLSLDRCRAGGGGTSLGAEEEPSELAEVDGVGSWAEAIL